MRLFTPRYWLSWLVIGAMYCIGRMPFRMQQVIALSLGRLLYLADRKHRKICRINIDLCFPDVTPIEKKKICRDSFYYIVLGLCTMCSIWFAPKKKNLGRLRVTGLENVHNAIARGKGVLLLGGHQAGLETGALLGTMFPTVHFYRKHSNAIFEKYTVECRGRYAETLISRNDVRGLVAEIQKKHVCTVVFDQDMGTRGSMFSPFFGVPASTPTVVPRLQDITKAEILVASFCIGQDGLLHVSISEPIHFVEGADIQLKVNLLNKEIEARIRQNSAQYLWHHKRFKTQPNGASSPYE